MKMTRIKRKFHEANKVIMEKVIDAAEAIRSWSEMRSRELLLVQAKEEISKLEVKKAGRLTWK